MQLNELTTTPSYLLVVVDDIPKYLQLSDLLEETEEENNESESENNNN